MEKSNKSLGFTLIELMVTLAIVAILISIGIPNLSNFLKNNTLSTNSSDFIGALNYTRSEAVKRGKTVTMCISNADFTECDNTRNWQDGWLIFTNPAGTDTVAGNTLLRVHHGLTGQGVSLVGSALGAGEINNITYLGTGIMQARTFVLCDDREIQEGAFKAGGEHARAIVINSTGRPMSIAGDDSRLPVSVTDCTP